MSGHDRNKTRSHAAKPHHIFRPNFKTKTPSHASVLSHSAAHLLDDLNSQFNGKNNGDFSAAPSTMMLFGWTSKGAICNALDELLAYGFIEQTRQGGRNRCSLYAVTWCSIDECQGKIDVNETRAASNLWKPENKHKIDKRFIERFEKKPVKR
jgi:hypothetical protein